MAKTTPKRYGLTTAQAEESRRKHGENRLTERGKRSAWLKLLDKFADPLIRILLVAAVLSIGISFYEFHWLDAPASVFFEPVGIVIAILLATGLAFIFENKAEREFSLLNLVNDEQEVKVMRDGHLTTVARHDIVVGDVVRLATGDEIPADGILTESTSMQVDESSLTGEPIASKSCSGSKEESENESTYAANRVLRGTHVVEGHGWMEVEAVGDATECGRVFQAVQIDDSVKTPLNEQLDRLGRWISIFSFSIAALVVALKALTFNWQSDWSVVELCAYMLKALMIAVTFIVVAVPEGLPMAVTLSLAYNMRRMFRTNNLVRRLHACETMGAVDVICTDKTGTLTQNHMTVVDMTFFGTQDNTEDLVRGIAVNSTASLDGNRVVGNPTEGALLQWACKTQNCGFDRLQELRTDAETIEEVPFSTEIKYMLTRVRNNQTGDVTTYVKGAPEVIAEMCGNKDEWKDNFDTQLKEYQSKAMRTLALATDHGKGLVMTALAAIADPVRDEVPKAVAECHAAGIDVIIITGDSTATANEIGRQIGVEEDHIIARARPMDKKEKVEELQRKGHVVAVTGDGTNDAPALKAAHVGLSMGDGTAVAREASDITIVDNSFASIVKAVMWGRSLFKNIQRFILFQMTVNIVACITVIVGAFMGTENPLNVTQMLWVNLIMDTLAAMALASLPPSSDVMQEKPRNRRKFIISPQMMKNMAIVGSVHTIVLGALLLLFKNNPVDSLSDLWSMKFCIGNAPIVMHEYELTFFFTAFVMLQLWNLFNVRCFATNAIEWRFEWWGKEFAFIATLIFVGQIVIVSLGREMFGVTPLDWASWGFIIVSTFIINLLVLCLTRLTRSK